MFEFRSILLLVMFSAIYETGKKIMAALCQICSIFLTK